MAALLLRSSTLLLLPSQCSHRPWRTRWLPQRRQVDGADGGVVLQVEPEHPLVGAEGVDTPGQLWRPRVEPRVLLRPLEDALPDLVEHRHAVDQPIEQGEVRYVLQDRVNQVRRGEPLVLRTRRQEPRVALQVHLVRRHAEDDATPRSRRFAIAADVARRAVQADERQLVGVVRRPDQAASRPATHRGTRASRSPCRGVPAACRRRAAAWRETPGTAGRRALRSPPRRT